MTDALARPSVQSPARSGLPGAHRWPMLVFLILAGLAWWANTVEPHIPSDHVNIATMVLKIERPELFRGDLGFDDSAPFRFYTPIYRKLMTVLAGWTGSLLTAPQPLTPLLVLAYLAGCYFLFYRLTGHVLASFLMAVLSLPQWKAIYDSWGLDVPMNTLPRSIFTASSPWLALGLWQVEDRLGLQALIFFAVGLLANLHPVSAFGFAQVLLFVVLWQGRFRPQAFIRCAVLGVVASVPTVWFALTYWQGTHLEGTPTLPYAVVQDVLEYRLSGFYPIPGEKLVDTLKSMALPGVLAGGWLWHGRRERWESQVRWLVGFILGVVLAAFVGTAVIQVVSQVTKTKPVSFDQFRTLRFVYLPLFALATFQVAYWFDKVRPERTGLYQRVTVAAALLYCLGTFWPHGTALGQRWDRLVGRSRDRVAEQQALYDLGDWVRTNTPANAMIDCDSPLFRFVAQRALVYCDKDGGILIYSGSQRVLEWHRRFWEQFRLKSGDSAGRAAFARQHGAQYVALNRDWPALPEPCLYENRYLKLYALAPERRP